MGQAKPAELIARLRHSLAPLRGPFGIVSATLYGSQARGEARIDSDIDLLVDFDHTPSLFEMARLAMALEEDLAAHVDLTTPASLHPLLRERVHNEGLRV